MGRRLMAVAVVVAVFLGCGPLGLEIDGKHHGPTRAAVEAELGPPVEVRSEGSTEILVYCGEEKPEGGYAIWDKAELDAAGMNCEPQLEMYFFQGRLVRIEQVPPT